MQKQLIKVLSKHGKRNPIKEKELVAEMRNQFPNLKYSARQLRNDVQAIRTNNLMPRKWIVSGNFGYYVTANESDVRLWAHSYLSRIKDMAQVLNGLKKRYKDYNYSLEF